MSTHEQINATFRHVAPSDELMTHIRREGEHLRAQHPGLGAIDTTLERIGRRGRKGRLFGARVELNLPGHRLVAKARAEDPYDALQRAFRTIERSARERVERSHRTRLRSRISLRRFAPA
ncbi:MAG: HPF/RaiA family ribosome-associated protein [Myxococcales bacterium]|nr:HPF/RaiA family ribosome-associated protein [Myxococcales bacterium]